MESSLYWDRMNQMPAGRAFEAYHLTDTTPQPKIIHSHEHYEIYFFLSGHTRLIIEDVDIYPCRGDVVVIPPHCMHRNIHLDADEPYERFYLYATREFLQTVTDGSYSLAAETDALLTAFGYHFRLNDTALEELIRLTDELILCAQLTTPAEQMLNRCRMGMLLIRIMLLLRAGSASVQDMGQGRMNELIRYLNEHVTQGVTLEELAEKYYVSKFALLREFRAHTGMTIHQYILAKRVLLAQELIRRGMKPNQVSDECGFADYTSFYRAFRRRMGISPSQYGKRQENGQKENHPSHG